MRDAILLLSFFALFSCNKERNDWDKLHLSGDVKCLTESVYSANTQTSAVEKGALLKTEKYMFDKDGRIVQQITMEDSDTTEKTQFIYDKQLLSGKVICDGSDQEIMRISYSYDENGRPSEVGVRKFGELVYIEKTEYNDENKIETMTCFDGKGEYQKKEERKIGKNGLPKEVEIFDEKRELVNCRKEEYDPSGNLIDFTVYAADEQTPVLEVRRKYDQLGNLLIQEAVDLQGQEAFETEEYRYTFDKKKNWEKSVRYVGGKAKEFTERVIEYY